MHNKNNPPQHNDEDRKPSVRIEHFINDLAELRELLGAHEYIDEESAADMIAAQITLLRVQIEKNVKSLSLDNASISLDPIIYRKFFTFKGDIILLLAEAALDTDDLEDAYKLYSLASVETVSNEQKLSSILGSLFARSALRADGAKAYQLGEFTDAGDFEEVFTLIEGNDSLTKTFIDHLFQHCSREYQNRMMLKKDRTLGLLAKTISCTLRQSIINGKLPYWVFDLFEGLLSYMDGNESDMDFYFHKAVDALPVSTYPESTQKLKELMSPKR